MTMSFGAQKYPVSIQSKKEQKWSLRFLKRLPEIWLDLKNF
jgi:hypothetical protein